MSGNEERNPLKDYYDFDCPYCGFKGLTGVLEKFAYFIVSDTLHNTLAFFNSKTYLEKIQRQKKAKKRGPVIEFTRRAVILRETYTMDYIACHLASLMCCKMCGKWYNRQEGNLFSLFEKAYKEGDFISSRYFSRYF